MSLDFAVLGQSGAPEKTVSLSVNVHHELITEAATRRLEFFRGFADYYKDVEISVDNLPGLAEQIQVLRTCGDGSDELQNFLLSLGKLIAYAMAERKALHAIAD